MTADSLDILVKAQADSAARSLERLVNMFDQMRVSVASLSDVGGGLAGTASAIQRFVIATKEIQGIGKKQFTALKNSINAIGKIDSVSVANASQAINKMVVAFSSLNNIKVSDSVKHFAELATAIKQLGYKSADKAIQNIPNLAIAMNQLMATLSKAPQVSQNIIDMTNALAALARTGASSGAAANALSRSMNTYSSSSARATKSSFSLASAIGKVYATYWMLFRIFRILNKAINLSSQLTEVQNIVDVTFGKYASLVDKMAETSITDFGMSELTVKQVASRFQAMGSAMEISQKQAIEASEFLAQKGVSAYGDLGDSMADVSLNLTKLTADMASFYNLSQEDVAEDLQSIFTGQTRPLRQYGLDLTEATLKEWAMKNGLDANIQAMSQAEKTMLRYQYVMSQTGAAHGDFARTINTWANQVRILKENFRALGGVVGGTLINMFKPLVSALNVVIGKLISFAKVVSASLGKIFGWEFQESGNGGVVNDFEDMADSAGGLESGTGGAADNLGDAANNAKKLKDYMLGIDELNVLAPDDSSSGGGSGGSGGGSGGSGGGGGASSSDSGGQWVRTETIWKQFESELDTLFKLGEYIGNAITESLNGIDWESVYEGARNFGSGLAEFLNGLISPELFGAVGTTIAGALNTAIYAALSFGTTFDFEDLGVSISTGLNEFFEEFDFVAIAETLNVWVDGLETAIGKALQTFEWDKALASLVEGLATLEIDTIAVIIGAFVWKETNPLKLIKDAILAKVGIDAISINLPNILNFSLAAAGTLTLGTPAFDVIGANILDGIGGAINKLLPEWVVDLISAIGAGISLGGLAGSWFPGAGTIAGAIIGAITGAISQIKIDGISIFDVIFNFDITNNLSGELEKILDNIKKSFEEQNWGALGANIIMGIIGGFIGALVFLIEPVLDLFMFLWDEICKVFGIHSPATKMEPIGENILFGIIEGFTSSISEWIDSISEFITKTKENLLKKWGDVKFKIGSTIENFKQKVSDKWDEVVEYWEDKDILEEVKTTYENFRQKVSDKWNEVIRFWDTKNKLEEVKTTYENFKSKVKTKWEEVVTYWNSKDELKKISTTVESIAEKVKTAWNSALTWWNNNVKFPKLNISFGFSTDSIRSSLNQVISFINSHIIDNLNKIRIQIPKLNLGPLGIHGGQIIGFNLSHIKAFEDGGFPKRADLFWANENGVPELVGTMGGKTAVASGGEITGISDAVYATGEREASLLADAVMYLRQIAAKEMSVRIGDKEIARSNNRGQHTMGMRLIKEI